MWKRHPMLREERWIVQIYPASKDGVNPGFCLANTPSRMVNSLDSLYRGPDSLWTYVQAQTCLCFGGSNSCVRVLYFFVSGCYCESYQVFRWEWSLATSLCHCERKCPRLGIQYHDQTLVSRCFVYPNISLLMSHLWFSYLSHGLEILA